MSADAGTRPRAKSRQVRRNVSLAVGAVQKRETPGIADIGASAATSSFETLRNLGRAVPLVCAQSDEQRFVPSGNRNPPKSALTTSLQAPESRHVPTSVALSGIP